MDFISGLYFTALMVIAVCFVSIASSAKEFVKMYQKENGT